MAITPTVVITFAAASLPYLFPLADPLGYRHPLAWITITVAVIDSLMVPLPARLIVSWQWALVSWLRALRRRWLCTILGFGFTGGKLVTEDEHSWNKMATTVIYPYSGTMVHQTRYYGWNCMHTRSIEMKWDGEHWKPSGWDSRHV